MKYYIIIGVIALALIIIYQVVYNRFSRNLAKVLYADLNPEGYLQQLSSLPAKLMISKNRRLFLALDALAYQGDHQGMQQVFSQLEARKLSYGQKINLYDKQIQFFVDTKDYEAAKSKLALLQKEGSKINNANMQYLLENVEALVEIYANHNGSYAKKMVMAAEKNPTKLAKATYYYRAAKCYYYQKDNQNTLKYLKKARNNAANTSLAKHIDSCLEDNEKLNDM